jgi:hypothetical protein
VIRSGRDFSNNGDGYVLVHFRSPHDTNGNSLHAWVAFDYDTGAPIAVSDTDGELEGDQLQLTVWYRKRQMQKLIDRMEFP